MSYELHTKSKEIQTVFTQENEHMKLQAKQAQISNKMTTNNNETSSRDKMCFELCCRKKVISNQDLMNLVWLYCKKAIKMRTRIHFLCFSLLYLRLC